MASKKEQAMTFKMSEPTITIHDGQAYSIRTCEELVEGRWEAFITMRKIRQSAKGGR